MIQAVEKAGILVRMILTEPSAVNYLLICLILLIPRVLGDGKRYLNIRNLVYQLDIKKEE
jgi:hypothetical protein